MNLLNHSNTNDLISFEFLLYQTIKSGDIILHSHPKFTSEYIQERKNKMIKHIEILDELKKLPFIKQRTPEWFEARKSRLTASDLYEAIKENNLRLAKKKANVIKDNTNYATIPALKWGTMFELMASRCYSYENNKININEFGLILDKNQDHFGASPDGINDMGVMIEIKCPYSREIIDGNIPEKYYMQIQGQLAVCQLEFCDYIECDFKIYDTEVTYIENILNNKNIKYHGVIAEFYDTNLNEYEYLYSDPDMEPIYACQNIRNKVAAKLYTDGLIFKKFTYWYLNKINIQRITFDENLWKTCISNINEFWEKVEECKLLPCEEVKQKQKYVFIEDDD